MSPTIVSAQLKLSYQEAGKPSQNSKSGSKCIFTTILTVYAPTFRASPEKKEFFADLQATVDSVDDNGVLLLVSNLNARVGSSVRGGGVPPAFEWAFMELGR